MNLNTVGLKNGIVLMMMGTVGELLVAPKEKVVFVEDLSSAQLASAVSRFYSILSLQIYPSILLSS